jgi:hypothetical protein
LSLPERTTVAPQLEGFAGYSDFPIAGNDGHALRALEAEEFHGLELDEPDRV